MAKQVMSEGPMDASSPLLARDTGQAGSYARLRQPSYRPTGWSLADRALDVVDTLTNGRAEMAQRIVSYLVIGGFAACVNLMVFSIMLNVVSLPVSHLAHYLIAEIVASEISIMANFIPNDHFTFRHLSGHDRVWAARALRFHMTAIAGTLLTILISTSLDHFGVWPLLAQAIAIIIALAFNFTFHHLFTYRHVQSAS